MKYFFILPLIFLSFYSCKTTSSKTQASTIYQPISDYVNFYNQHRKPVRVFSLETPLKYVYKTLQHGWLSNQNEAQKFTESIYYHKEQFEQFYKDQDNDNLQYWGENDLGFEYKIMEEKKISRMMRGNFYIEGRLYDFSNIIYDDNGIYCMFKVTTMQGRPHSSKMDYDEAVIIMKKENSIWKLEDEVRIPPDVIIID
ncbi:hypothetical protein KJK34_00285 [Flavobacterium sp. D11R37]|uniref:hypothetical protein n=1 Tax=Flavobacterium coralii TaxID=2838017 RepID=UPI001CA7AE18|nr:hypothetical protein [Flavobacterium coralii]MBY8961180.1 hypothetical protein [Flavobacterium coralii]